MNGNVWKLIFNMYVAGTQTSGRSREPQDNPQLVASLQTEVGTSRQSSVGRQYSDRSREPQDNHQFVASLQTEVGSSRQSSVGRQSSGRRRELQDKNQFVASLQTEVENLKTFLSWSPDFRQK